MPRHNILYFINVCAIIFTLSSCNTNIVYHEFIAINKQMWNKHDTLCFTLDSCYVGKLSNNKLNLEIEIRNTNQYPFRNLLLCISHLQKDQKTIQTDTLNLQLANSNNHWLGSGWGGIYTTIAEPITIEISANNPFIKITHFMNTEELEGIHDVGIKIEE